MHWLFLGAGLAALFSAGLLTIWLTRMKGAPNPFPGWLFRYVPIKFTPSAVRLLRRAARVYPHSPEFAALQDSLPALMEQLLLLQRGLHSAPTLPAGADREPRLMPLARDAVSAGDLTQDALCKMLADWPDGELTPTEAAYFPLCVGSAQCQRLAEVIRSMLRDAKERTAAAKLARRLIRCKQPLKRLARSAFHSAGIVELISCLREKEQHELLSAVAAWLESRDSSVQTVTQQATERRVRQAEEIRRAEACFSALARLDWLPCCENVDAMHALLQQDPECIYPHMPPDARLSLRRRAEALCRRVKLSHAVVVGRALQLSNDAEERSLEAYVGYWFQDATGLKMLHASLPTRKGRLYARFALRRPDMVYAGLWGFCAVSGFLFLQARNPVFMLPIFALVSGTIIRFLLHGKAVMELPRKEIPAIPEEMRTLVVLPATLHDTHEAIRYVRRLKTIRHAFAQDGVDFLLLGDFADSMTAVSSQDAAIIHAAAASIAALEDERCMYLQRSRRWNSDRHVCCARGGRMGALSEICRLIVQGECEDVIAYASVQAAHFERRYAYVLLLDPDRQPAPGMLEALLQCMTHPLCGRYPTPERWRGFSVLSPEGQDVFDGAALIRPDVYLEATDGIADVSRDSAPIFGELAGHASIPGAHMQRKQDDPPLQGQYDRAHHAWGMARWQLPWVQTPSGLVRNPLPRTSRFHLREQLRQTLVPAAQCLLLLWAVLTGRPLLFFFALLAPEISRIPRRLDDIIHLACRLSLLPARAAVSIRALFDAIVREPKTPPPLLPLEIWTQGVSATVMAALGISLPGMALPALALGTLFACFPLAHKYGTAATQPSEGLNGDHIAMLQALAARTWSFFSTHVTDAAHGLPPCAVQYDPDLGPEDATTPAAIADYMLACICAKELELIQADDAAKRIQQTLSALSELSMPFGLPCRRYSLSSLTVLDPCVDAAETGVLLASLMTAAQALRVWLPELSSAYENLSADAMRLAASFDLTRLYNDAAGQFHAQLDENGQPQGHVTCLADETLLLSISACAQRIIPPEHFARLSRSCVRWKGQDILLARHGSAPAHLLAGLFFPIDEEQARRFIAAMQACGQDGLFGQGRCGYFSFEPTLRYRRAEFGLPEASLSTVNAAPIFAPYAVALCLPFAPRLAGDALLRFQALSAEGPWGLCDAVDCTHDHALIGMHDAFHQGILLIAAAHMLADAPVQRYFGGLPSVEACLPLLEAHKPPMILPAITKHRPVENQSDTAIAAADSSTVPAEAHLLGTEDFHLLVNAHGTSFLHDRDLPLTSSTDGQASDGVLFYLADEGRVYQLGDPLLPGQVLFAPGEARFEQICGSLKAELVCLADTVRRRALHVLTITNLSTRDRVVDVADFVPPDLNVPLNTLEAHRPDKLHLTLHARGAGHTLHHTVNASVPLLSLAACSDRIAFLGRGRTLQHPASLEEPPHDLLIPSAESCLSFRARISLGGRGQATLWYTTSLQQSEPPQLTDIPGIRKLAALQHAAICEAAPLNDEQHMCAQRLISLMHGAPCQLALTLEQPSDMDVLADMTAIFDHLLLRGVKTTLLAICSEDIRSQAEELLQGHPSRMQITFAAENTSLDSLLTLAGSAPLLPQLDALFTHAAPSRTLPQPPRPALLPRTKLDHPSSYGGFDPESSAYVIELEPGLTTPAPWINIHAHRYYQETVCENGFGAPFHEQLWIEMADGTVLSPWHTALARNVRMEPGLTIWEAWSDKLDLRLCAACIPGHRGSLRVLRLRNATDDALSLHFTVQALLGSGRLECAPGIVMAAASPSGRSAYLAGEGWTALRMHPPFRPDTPPFANSPDAPDGSIALLSRTQVLPPKGSAEVVWLSGYARHTEDVVRALDAAQAHGSSAVLRSVKAGWAQKMGRISISTPEDTLDLLMNAILPVQALQAEGIGGVPALIFLSPADAKWQLLRYARAPHSREEWATMALLAALYTHSTQDQSLLDIWLPHRSATLYDVCRSELLTLPLDHHSLPLGDAQARRCMLFALSAHAMEAQRHDPALAEFSRKLLNAADTYLWEDSCYGMPLQLDVQALACTAYGSNPRTRQAMRTAWMTLYNPPHGLIRHQEPTDAAPLPGLPENGGMHTLSAALCLHALMMTGNTNEAHELLRALNPIHHTDDSQRMETFRGAPYRLHGGMQASPMEAGRAVPEGGAVAAGLLYAVVLQDILGLHREGSIIGITPRVPPDWEDYTLTLQEGGSTWHISVERRVKCLTIDGTESSGHRFTIHDDGRIHQVRVPLT